MANDDMQRAGRTTEQVLGAIDAATFRRFAVAVVLLAAALMTPSALAAGLGGHSVRFTGFVSHSYSANHVAGLHEFGGHYARTPGRYGNLGSARGGWYHQGFGGTLSPGWNYGFAPRLGGIGH
jgi:hypothetical protein